MDERVVGLRCGAEFDDDIAPAEPGEPEESEEEELDDEEEAGDAEFA